MLKKEFVLEKLSENIRAERARKHYSQEFLAEKVDITPQHLYRIENAKVCPTIYVTANIAKALNITLNDLFDVNE
jgi:DNA-binding XRE family transcriptional regulator